MRLAGPLPQIVLKRGVYLSRLLLLRPEGTYRQRLPNQLKGTLQKGRVMLWVWVGEAYHEELSGEIEQVQQGWDVQEH